MRQDVFHQHSPPAFVLPIASVVIEASTAVSPDLLWLVGKWFVFWACGVRLFGAGITQTLKPEFTAKSIFEIDAPPAYAIVREVGFGNLAMGTLGLATLQSRPGSFPQPSLAGSATGWREPAIFSAMAPI